MRTNGMPAEEKACADLRTCSPMPNARSGWPMRLMPERPAGAAASASLSGGASVFPPDVARKRRVKPATPSRRRIHSARRAEPSSPWRRIFSLHVEACSSAAIGANILSLIRILRGENGDVLHLNGASLRLKSGPAGNGVIAVAKRLEVVAARGLV